MSAVKLFVPRDSAALAVGADEVAAALQQEAANRGSAVVVVRNSSRGMFWLETWWRLKPPTAAWLMALWSRKMCQPCWMLACCKAQRTPCATA